MNVDELNTLDEKQHTDIKESISELEKTQLLLIMKIGELTGKNSMVPVLIKYVIFPLIIVLGGKIGLDYFAGLGGI